MTNLKHWDLASVREGLVSDVVGIFRAVLLRETGTRLNLKIVLEVLIFFHSSHVLLFRKVRVIENLLVLE